MYILKAQVFNVRATHTDHYALSVITTHSNIKTLTNIADAAQVHSDARQQVANDPSSWSSIHTDARRNRRRDGRRCAISLSVMCLIFFIRSSLYPKQCLWKCWRKRKTDVLKASFLVSELAFVWTLTSMLVSHLCIIVHVDSSITDWIVCLASLFGIF